MRLKLESSGAFTELEVDLPLALFLIYAMSEYML